MSKIVKIYRYHKKVFRIALKWCKPSGELRAVEFKGREVSGDGFPFFWQQRNPRLAIQHTMGVGDCWSFKGSRGVLVIQLSARIIVPTSFTVEHINKALAPSGNIDSAPKDFVVLGLSDDKDTEGKELGRFTYRDDGEPIQQFLVNDDSGEAHSFVELRILSNHGEPDYTCLRRMAFRHGSENTYKL